MSRSNYTDDCDNLYLWRGAVDSAMRGMRGQKLLGDLVAALDAMPVKRLIAWSLETDGEVCALGACGRSRGIDVSKLDPEEPSQVAKAFNIAPALAQEIVYMNDEYERTDETPEARWVRMRKWAASQIVKAGERVKG